MNGSRPSMNSSRPHSAEKLGNMCSEKCFKCHLHTAYNFFCWSHKLRYT